MGKNDWISIDGHDYCSPSRLELCSLCPGYARLKRELENNLQLPVSPHANKGKLLHQITKEALEGKPIPQELSIEDKMLVEYAVNKSTEINNRFAPDGAIIQYEVQIDLSKLNISSGANGCRIDHLIIIPEKGWIVIDWKFGWSWTKNPASNLQIMAYCWGIYNKYGGHGEGIIIQPQADDSFKFRSSFFDEDDLKEIETRIKNIVTMCHDEEAILNRGSHCDKLFCELKSVCPLWKNALLDIPQHKDITSFITNLTPEGRKELYDKLNNIINAATELKDTIKTLVIEKNIPIDGYVVAPGRSTYTCPDLEKFINTLSPIAEKKKVSISDLIIPAKPKTKSDVKKILGTGKEIDILLKELYIETKGALTLKPI